MLSFLFLLSLFYLRFIPVNIFWGIYFCFFGRNSRYNIFYQPIIAFFAILSYLPAVAASATLPIALVNYSIQDYQNGSLVPMLLLFGPSKNTYFSFLLTEIVCNKKIASFLKNFAQFIRVMALVTIVLGGIDVFNDYNSHVNPDVFDLLFPKNGAVMFWGGAAVFIFTYFHLSFLTGGTSLVKWKGRLNASSGISPFLRYFAVSQSLLHPYFFLSLRGRRLVGKNKKLNKKLILLLKKAFVEERDEIPDEWLD